MKHRLKAHLQKLAALAGPACELCTKPMRFVGLEGIPHNDQADLCTYECGQCGRVRTRVVGRSPRSGPMERPVVNAAQSLRSACKEEEAIMLAPREISHTTNDPDEWQPIATAPFDRDLELAVINYYGVHTLIFPCRRILTGWLKSGTQEQVNVLPTHWREWEDARSALFSLVPTLKRGSNF